MYLERLVIQGFKSFAERLELTFEPGIAAIVGPNGSGKSNIVDAIRWALGEQSLHALRGERLEDIIFSGSDHRRAHGLAEVTLVFANADGRLPVPYSEVSVTRRAYRSGNSEFLLNGVACRLKDIQELFWDTGLGREGYSFIGQGRVDEVLNLKPEERRVFLEQAAGVWKYRQRKKEAAAKLAEIDQDLVRLNDVQAELERQRGPLEEEARRAERCLEKSRRLKDLEVFLGLTEIKELAARLDAARAQAEADRLRLATLAGRRSQLEARLEKDKLELAGKEAAWQEQGCALHRLEEKLAAIERSRTELTAAGRERAARVEALARRREEIARERQELGRLLAQEKDEQAAVQQALEERRAALAALEDAARRAEAELSAAGQALRERRERTIALLSERAAKANALQALDHEEKKLKERRERVLATGKAAKARAEELAVARDKENTRLAARKKDLAARQEERAALEKELERLQGVLEEERRQSQDAWRELERARAELTTQKNLLQNHDGYSQGPRAVLKAKLPGIHGAVADLLEVPAGLELALEAALGGAQEYLVAETDEEAAAAIAWLKEKGLGRATFLPLNTVRTFSPRPEERKLGQHPDVLGWAAELVDFAPRHRAAVEHLLGRVLVARTLAAARTVARAAGYRLKIVTVEGDVLSPGGSMSGGSRRREQRSLFTRARRVRELEKAVEAAGERFAAAEARTEQAKKRTAELREALGRLEQELRELEQAHSAGARALAQYEAQLAELGHARSTWEEEAAALAESLRELAGERARAEDERAQLAAAIERWEEETHSLENREAGLRAAAAAAQEKVTRMRLDLAALEEKARNLALREKEREEALLRLERELAEQETRVREMQELDRAAAGQRRQLEKEQAVHQAAWAALRAKLDKLAARVGDLRRALEEEEKAGRALRRQEDALRQTVHEEEVTLERLAAEHAAAERRLFETYGVPQGAPLPALELSVEEARARVAELKAALAALGEVNLKAPQMLAELKERCSFLAEQAGDLMAARDSLEKMMREIDRTVARRLEDTYGELRVNFQEVFQRLFGGGRADLVLTGSEDPLTAGLEIFAQLPGKKMQPLSLLSGGERALTGIAFLFALLTARTSSLCVLDEIDAALDEANAARFLSYLEELAVSTQFIMITHRKQAMLRAKSLYGLAMGASGVSRLVSIRLEEAV
ncbi:MAG: chromosome segregation protein [Bacillota bacterium]|nr:chromosome segregation protein [Bacillota bacterium]